MPVAAGYMMIAGHFSRNLVSSGDLNRGSQDGVPRAFYVTFCTTQKVTIRFPYGKASRFCEPRSSAPKLQLRTNPIKTFENFYILFVRYKKRLHQIHDAAVGFYSLSCLRQQKQRFYLLLMAACAAASLAIGTRNGEQET